QRDKLRGEGKLAISRLPARGEDEHAAFVFRNFQQGRIRVVEPSQNPRAGQSVGLELAVLPEMNFGEVTEARIGERGEQRMFKINLAEHRVAARRGLGGG